MKRIRLHIFTVPLLFVGILLGGVTGAWAQTLSTPAVSVVAGDTAAITVSGLNASTSLPPTTIYYYSEDPDRVQVVESAVQASYVGADSNTYYYTTLTVPCWGIHRVDGLFTPIPVQLVAVQYGIIWADTCNVTVNDPTITYSPGAPAVRIGDSVPVAVRRAPMQANSFLDVELTSSHGSIMGTGATQFSTNRSFTLHMPSPQNSKTIYLTGIALDSGIDATNVTLTARVGSYVSSVSVAVTRNSGLVLAPASPTVTAGDAVQMTITRSTPTNVSPLTVSLVSDDPAVLTVPQTVTIPAYAQYANFSAYGAIPGTTALRVFAVGVATNPSSVQTFTVTAPTLALAPNPLTALVSGSNIVTITRPSNRAGGDLTVTVQPLDSTFCLVSPKTITIPSGYINGSFSVSGLRGGTNIVTASVGSYSTNLTVVIPALSLQLSAAATNVPAGDAVLMTLTRSSSGDLQPLVVTMVSDDGSIASVPATVTIPVGSMSASFNAAGVGPGLTTIRAFAPGVSTNASTIVSLTVNNPQLAFNPNPVAPLAGGNRSVTITRLPSQMGAGLVVSLTAVDPALCSVSPSTLTIPAGSINGTFTVNGLGSGTNFVVAAVGSYSTNLTVVVPSFLVQLSAATPTVIAGDSLQMTATRSGSGSLTPLTVTLISDNQTAVTVPASVIIPIGSMSAAFSVRGVAPGSSIVRAFASGATTNAGAVYSVTVSNPQLTFVPNPVTPLVNGSASVTITRPSLNVGSDLLISLTPVDSSFCSVSPATFPIAQGAVSASFTVTGLKSGTNYVTASVGSYSTTLVVSAAAYYLQLAASTSIYAAGDAQAVTISRVGSGTLNPLTVSLVSDNPDVVEVPSTVIIPAGSQSTAFNAHGLIPGGSIIRAIAAGVETNAASAMAMTVVDPQLTFTPNPVSAYVGANNTVVISRPGSLADGNLVITLSVLNSTICGVSPATVTIPAGSVSATITVPGYASGTNLVTAQVGTYTTNLFVTVPQMTLNLSLPNLIHAGSDATGSITRVGGSLSSALIVNLANSMPSNLSVPSSVTIPGGSGNTPFTIEGLEPSTGVVVTASAVGFPSTSMVVRILPSEPYLASIDWRDYDTNSVYSSGDTVRLTFNSPIDIPTLTIANLALKQRNLLNMWVVSNATWGAGASVNVVNPGTDTVFEVTLGTAPFLAPYIGVDPADAVTDILRTPDNTVPPVLLPATETDSDNDGMPDWWEEAHFLSSRGATPDGDPDGDLLSNLWEYRLRGDPLEAFSLDKDGISPLFFDGAYDSDGDGLANAQEVDEFLTDPANPDTDDDGFSDGAEIFWETTCGDRHITDPNDSRSPLIARSLVLDGAAHVVPNIVGTSGDRFNLDAFTIECWVLLTNTTATGNLIVRTVTNFNSSATNFALRLDNNVPSVRFTSISGHEIKTGGINDMALPTNEWIHLAGSFDPNNSALTLYINGVVYRSQMTLETPAMGVGRTTIGQGITGYIDEVRVWSIARTADEIGTWFDRTLVFQETTQETSGSGGAYKVAATSVTTNLWSGLLGGNKVPAGISDMTISYVGHVDAAGTYANFPTLPNLMPTPLNGIVLSSGKVADLGVASNTTASRTANLGTAGDSGMAALVNGTTYDAVALVITFTSDSSVKGLSFNLLFGSEEFPEYVGSYNDAFAAFLDGENISFDSNGKPVTVNNNFFQLDNDSWHPNDPDAAGKMPVNIPFELDGLTPLLVTSKKLTPGQHTLKLMVSDTGDAILDSAAFLSNFKFALTGAEGTTEATSAGSESDLVALYFFDDSENTSNANKWNTNAICGYGAEDSIHKLDWNYAITGVSFSASVVDTSLHQVADKDADGIPDWWENILFDGNADANTDSDGDGLNNLYEYLVDANPRNGDTDNDGIPDGAEDADDDGLSNAREQEFLSDPRLRDTDDDGVNDKAEVAAGHKPADALSPLQDRVLDVAGGITNYMTLPNARRFGLTSWTLMAWVRPDALGGNLLNRVTEAGVTNYGLGILANGQVVANFTADGPGRTNVTCVAPLAQALATGVWTHVAETFDAGSGVFKIYINGLNVATMNTPERPAVNGVGLARTTAFQGFNGQVDELGIFNQALDAEFILKTRQGIAGSGAVPTAYYRFDDGTSDTNNGAGVWTGVSLMPAWHRGQVQDFAGSYNRDWSTEWHNGGTLMGNANITTNIISPVLWKTVDTDGDGIPDWWEIRYFGDPIAADPAGDADGDLINNFWEYRLQGDPFEAFSLDGVLFDGAFDSDGDGLSNYEEIAIYATNPLDTDSDKDGVSDWQEVTVDLTSPYQPMSNANYFERSLNMATNHADISLPQPARFAVGTNGWTVEGWLMPGMDGTGYLFELEGAGMGGSIRVGITNYQPVARILSGTNVLVEAGGVGTNSAIQRLPSNEWSHVAFVWSPSRQSLEVFVNGILLVAKETLTAPVFNGGTAWFKRELTDGYLDEFRVWTYDRSWDELDYWKRRLVPALTGYMTTPTYGNPLALYYRFDGGTNAILDYAHLNQLAYTIANVSTTTNQAVVLLGSDDEDGDMLPEWWTTLNNIEQWPVFTYGPEDTKTFKDNVRGNVLYFNSFRGYGSVGNRWGWVQQPVDNVFHLPKTRELGHDGRNSLFIKYVYLYNNPRSATFNLFTPGMEKTMVWVNGTLLTTLEDLTNSLQVLNIATNLHEGRNMIIVKCYSEIEKFQDYERTKPSSPSDLSYYESARGKFDAMLTVDSVVHIARGDATRRDPRAVWHCLAWSDYWEETYGLSGQGDRELRYAPSNMDYGVPLNTDTDGLTAYSEYWSRTNPRDDDTDNNGVPDSFEDCDRDGLSNLEEQHRGTDPRLPDTDDDGFNDGDDVSSDRDPASALSPSISRALQLAGTNTDFVIFPTEKRFALADWTIEAYVKRATNANGGILVERKVDAVGVNYELGLGTGGVVSNNVPYIQFVTIGGVTALVRDVQAVGTGWTHVAATYSSANHELRLYTNGMSAGVSTQALYAPALYSGGPVVQRIGRGIKGLVDEVRIWNAALDAAKIRANYDHALAGNDQYLTAYYRFDDGTSYSNGSVLVGTSSNKIALSGKPWTWGQVQDFTTPYLTDWREKWFHSASFNRGGSANFSTNGSGAVLPLPALRVTILPSEAIAGGAQWSLGDGLWYNSDQTAYNLMPGGYSVVFRTIDGWTEPTIVTVVLTNGAPLLISRTYRKNGSLTVTFTPNNPMGAKWRIDNSAWYFSGDVITNLSVRPHFIEYASVTNYFEPPNENVTISEGIRTTLIRSYEVVVGSIQIFIEPQEAKTAGALWKVDNGDWLPSEAIVTNRALGTHVVSFLSDTNMAGWIPPDNQTYVLTKTSLIGVGTGVYRQVTGLYCDIYPPEVVKAGARWRVNGGNWTNSFNGVPLQISPGSYLLEFLPIAGWTTPVSQNVVITNQVTTKAQGSYYQFTVIGGTGTNLGYFRRPRSVVVDKLHNLYVADSQNNRVQYRNGDSNQWMLLGDSGPGTNVGQFNNPLGLAVVNTVNNNFIFVVDSGNNRIQRYNTKNKSWMVWGGPGPGNGQGEFSGPFDVAVDPQNNVYVADLYNNRVQKMTNGIWSTGVWSTFIANGFADGFVRQPRGLVIGTTNSAVIVADHDTSSNGFSRIQRFAYTGTYQDRLGSSYANQGGFNRPRGMCYSENPAQLFVADTENNRIAVATNFPYGWSTFVGGNALNMPEDVAYDSTKKLIIADTGNDRILELDLSSPTNNAANNLTIGVMPMIGLPDGASSKMGFASDDDSTMGFTVSWDAYGGWLYTVKYSTNLVLWCDLPGYIGLPGSNGTMICIDTNTMNAKRFYRISAY